jgi:integrase
LKLDIGHIRQRGDSYEYTIPLGTAANGKRKRITKGGFKNYQEAQKHMIQTAHELNVGTYVKPTQETTGDYMAKWVRQKNGQIEHATYTNFLGYLNNYFLPHIGHIKLSNLQPKNIQHMYDTMSAQGLSSQTIKHVHNCLRQGLDYAVRTDAIKKNPATLCMLPKMRRSIPDTWSIEEIQQFLRYAKSSRFYAAFLIAIFTGARQGEILALKWGDIDFNKKTLHIKASLAKIKKGYGLKLPKTKRSIRKISLYDFVVEELVAIRDSIPEGNKKQYNQSGHFIVSTRDGNYLVKTTLLKEWKKLIQESGVKPIRFHDLRHTHATILLQSGTNPKVISERLGHSAVSITLDIYSHLTPVMEEGLNSAMSQLVPENRLN